ncbi:MAG: hypothetical protein AMK72_06040 [Planctomycetes bacterium SM23_25]|nr:MAG: hypothetical protein AMS14_01575 [Planctomycetes bacterium DG_20]KPK48800.1 MAG: hypothetical protein AMK72_06040 [Planctomycetes bacterium SM23_25]
MSGSKLTILILAVASAFAFGTSLAFSLWFDGGPAEASGETETAAGPTGQPAPPELILVPADVTQLEGKHLIALIQDVRKRIRDCDTREGQMNEEKQRMRLTLQDLQKEAERVEVLRVQFDAAAAALRKAKVDLEKTRIAVAADEQKNLKRAAAVYDKMDAEAAAKIVEDMFENGQEEDAAKILYHMQERTVAKVLAAVSDKNKVTRLNDQMKRIHEEE